MQELGEKHEVVVEERKKYDVLLGVVREKEKEIEGLMREIRGFEEVI